MADAQTGTLLRRLHTLLQTEAATDLTDAVLLQRFTTQREEAAFTALMLRHGPMVLGVCRRILHNVQDAEDVFQATFLVLARKAGSIRKGAAVGSWLYGVAYRMARKGRQRLARQRHHERQAAIRPRGEPTGELALRELQVVLDEEVNRLPAKYRVAFVLCCLEGKSRAEAAQELGWKEGTLASRLAHARQLLQQRLTRRGVTLAAVLCATALAHDAAPAAVPVALVRTTVQAALTFATGGTPATVSAHATALAEGMLRTLFLGRVKLVALLLLALSLLTAGVGLAARQAQSEPAVQLPLAGTEAAQPNPVAQVQARTDQYGDPLPEGAVARYGTLRLRNCGPVAFSPDGRRIVTAGGATGSEVVFWDRQTGKEIRRLPGKDSILRLQFTPDGQRLAAWTGTVFTNPVRDVASGKVLFTFQGERGTFTSDGRHLFGIRNGPNGQIVGKWMVATGQPAGAWTMPSDARATCCSPDGRTAAYLQGNALVLYDLDNKVVRRRWASNGLRQLAFSPDGQRLAGWALRDLRLWEVASGRQVFSWGQLVDSAVVFSADGKRLGWTGYDERSIPYPWVADIGQGQPRRLGLPINNLPSLLAFSPDGQTLAVNTDARALELRDVTTGRDALPMDANTGRIFRLELTPDGRYLAVSDAFRVLVWDRTTGKLVRRFPEDVPGGKAAEPPMVWDVGITADGQLRRGVAARLDGRWTEVGPEALAKLQKLPLQDGGGKPAFAAFQGTVQEVVEARNGRYVAVRQSAQRPGVIDRMASVVIHVWDTRTGLLLDHVQLPGAHSLGAFSPDNRLLVTTAPGGTIQVWDLATGRERRRLPGHVTGMVRAVLFTPDSRLLFSGGDDSQVLLWDLTGRAGDGVWRTVRHEPPRQRVLWDALKGSDNAAYRAIWELAADPAGTVAFLKTRLKPVPLPNNKELARAIADLGSETFATREQAQAALRKVGPAAVPTLRAALAKATSLEQSLRLEKLVQELDSSPLTGDRLRAFRALEVLERIATPEARRLLNRLAQGPPAERFTVTAQESLARLNAVSQR